jgi:hypothetical protein
MNERRKPPNAGMGRIKGVPNKATRNARTAIAAFVKKNEDRLNRLLDEIEKREGARAAWECAMRLIEHHIPRVKVGDAATPLDRSGESGTVNYAAGDPKQPNSEQSSEESR